MKNQKTIIAISVALAILFVLGYAHQHMQNSHDRDHAEHDAGVGHAMTHKLYESTNLEKTPQVDLEIVADPHGGYNFTFHTENFVFAPDQVNQEHVEGQGHAHIFIDGVKSRVYSPIWWHSLSAGPHIITYTLNTNDHQTYASSGTAIGGELEFIAQ